MSRERSRRTSPTLLHRWYWRRTMTKHATKVGVPRQKLQAKKPLMRNWCTCRLGKAICQFLKAHLKAHNSPKFRRIIQISSNFVGFVVDRQALTFSYEIAIMMTYHYHDAFAWFLVFLLRGARPFYIHAFNFFMNYVRSLQVTSQKRLHLLGSAGLLIFSINNSSEIIVQRSLYNGSMTFSWIPVT